MATRDVTSDAGGADITRRSGGGFAATAQKSTCVHVGSSRLAGVAQSAPGFLRKNAFWPLSERGP